MLENVMIDQRGFFKGGEPYHPIISPNPQAGEVRAISIDLGLDATLDWEKETGEEELFWQLDFGLKREDFPWNSAAALSALLRGIDCFINSCLTTHSKQTLGVSLYDGPITADSIKFLAPYLQQLAAPFPDDAELFGCFDLDESTSQAQLFQLIAPNIFPYLHIGLVKSHYPLGVLRRQGQNWVGSCLDKIGLGVVIPLADRMAPLIANQVDKLLTQLEDQAVAYRLLYESHMSEQWDELDDLIVISASLSPQGTRKLRGFIAAGGRLITMGNPLELSGERSLEKFFDKLTKSGQRDLNPRF